MFQSLLWELYEMDVVHPRMLRKKFCLVFTDVTNESLGASKLLCKFLN